MLVAQALMELVPAIQDYRIVCVHRVAQGSRPFVLAANSCNQDGPGFVFVALEVTNSRWALTATEDKTAKRVRRFVLKRAHRPTDRFRQATQRRVSRGEVYLLDKAVQLAFSLRIQALISQVARVTPNAVFRSPAR